jgi:hypothetical protein
MAMYMRVLFCVLQFDNNVFFIACFEYTFVSFFYTIHFYFFLFIGRWNFFNIFFLKNQVISYLLCFGFSISNKNIFEDNFEF